MLVVGRTRSGKGLLATTQLLNWKHSAIVNDIKSELFNNTAGFRSSLGPVFVIDPGGVGHQFDPLASRQGEDRLYSAATSLLTEPNEGEGKIFTQRAFRCWQAYLGRPRQADASVSVRPADDFQRSEGAAATFRRRSQAGNPLS